MCRLKFEEVVIRLEVQDIDDSFYIQDYYGFLHRETGQVFYSDGGEVRMSEFKYQEKENVYNVTHFPRIHLMYGKLDLEKLNALMDRLSAVSLYEYLQHYFDRKEDVNLDLGRLFSGN
jgi:hypothetical protein